MQSAVSPGPDPSATTVTLPTSQPGHTCLPQLKNLLWQFISYHILPWQGLSPADLVHRGLSSGVLSGLSTRALHEPLHSVMGSPGAFGFTLCRSHPTPFVSKLFGFFYSAIPFYFLLLFKQFSFYYFSILSTAIQLLTQSPNSNQPPLNIPYPSRLQSPRSSSWLGCGYLPDRKEAEGGGGSFQNWDPYTEQNCFL